MRCSAVVWSGQRFPRWGAATTEFPPPRNFASVVATGAFRTIRPAAVEAVRKTKRKPTSIRGSASYPHWASEMLACGEKFNELGVQKSDSFKTTGGTTVNESQKLSERQGAHQLAEARPVAERRT